MNAENFPPIHRNLIYPNGAKIFKQNEGIWRIFYYDEITKRNIFEALSRYIWRFFNGPIPDGWVIHHKNSNPLDNHPDNLQAMSRSEHSRLHRTHPELKSQLYSQYQADNPGKEREKYEKYVAPVRKARRTAETGSTQ